MNNATDSLSQGPTSLYVHIPFCRHKCHYCDFVSYSGLEGLIPFYVEAVSKEARGWAHHLAISGESIQPGRTIYFGGGTPSLLTPEQVEQPLQACSQAFGIAGDAEITLEANPGTVHKDDWQRYLEAGINRLSLGAQSFRNEELRLLGRIHAVQDTSTSYRLARQAGHRNINLDLIYGLPRQTLFQWRTSLSQAMELEPEHLSLYPLTLGEETPMAQAIVRGELPAPDPDLAAEMYELAEEVLNETGYQHYEISNWAKPRHQCRHNLTYWRNQPYLGLGAAAHSYLGGYRFHNTPWPQKYISLLTQSDWHAGIVSNPVVEGCEPIDPLTEAAETIILGLRLLQGVNRQELTQRFGRDILAAHGPQVDHLCQVGLLEWHQDFLRLTSRGRLLGNEVFVRFLPAASD